MTVQPAAAGTSAPRFYRPELDILRFLAFGSVYLHHTTVLRSALGKQILVCCRVGLPLFFFLSSFLITELLAREKDKTGTIHLRQFYLRRILRIWPLYLTALVATLLFWHNPSPPGTPFSTGRFLAYLFMAANWYAIRTRDLGWNPVMPLWSISIEEQFYVVWPTLYKLGGRRSAIFASLLTVPIAYAAIVYCVRQPDCQDLDIWANSFVNFMFFGGGALLALYKDRLPQPRTRLTRSLVGFLGVLLSLAPEFVFHNFTRMRASTLIAGYTCLLFASICFLLAVYGSSQAAKHPRLAYLGKISYGLYVFHWMGLWLSYRLSAEIFHHAGPFVALATGAALTLVAAALSYRFLETPFLRLKDRFAFVRTRSI